MASEKPIPIALLVADDVYQDIFTNKWVIAGVFSQIIVSKLPATRDQFVVFWQVTGVHEAVDLRLRIEHCETGDPVFEGGGPISAESPLGVISVPIHFRKMEFQKQGKYWVQLLSEEEILIQSPLYVTLTQPKVEAPRTSE